MTFSELCNQIFNQAIRDYHIKDNIDSIHNPSFWISSKT